MPDWAFTLLLWFLPRRRLFGWIKKMPWFPKRKDAPPAPNGAEIYVDRVTGLKADATPYAVIRTTEEIEELRRLADGYRQLVGEAMANLQQHVFVYRGEIAFSGLEANTEPYLELIYYLFNGCPFRIRAGQTDSGDIDYNGDHLLQPRTVSLLDDLQVAATGKLTIRQVLSQATARDIYSHKGEDISISTRDLRLSVEGLDRSGVAANLASTLQIPRSLTGVVPQNIPHKQWMGMYLA